MDANAILEKIVQEGAETAQKLLADAKSKAEELKKASEERIDQQKAATEERIRTDGEQLRDRMLRMAELDWKKDSLSARRKVLDKAFDKALEELEAADPEKLYGIFLTLAKQNAQGGEEVLVGDKASGWYRDEFLSETNAALAAEGKTDGLKKGSGSVPGVGFALLKDGMQVNCTLGSLLNQERHALEIEVSRVLFG